MITRLNQLDKRWRNALIGNSSIETIGGVGCLLSCFAMLAGYNSVGAMNVCRKKTGGFMPDLPPDYKGAWAANFDISKCAPHVKLAFYSHRWKEVNVPQSDVDNLVSALRIGRVAIIEVDGQMLKPGFQQHFVLATGLNQAGDIMINDPYGGAEWPLCPRYGKSYGFAIWRFVTYSIDGGNI